ncbi:hypothetical protein B0H10DRAFT_1921132 [Mycena sp. CBHHK59/15]|nr:hypothetical protein B0H10DRAFT_1921132 [Mycena sp. CBHHK59/15]
MRPTSAILLAATAVSTFSSVFAACDPPDNTAPTCQTTAGSPLISDCQVAIEQLGTNNRCLNTNMFGSECTTITSHNTCKIDACSIGATYGLQQGVDCGGYLQTLINSCAGSGDAAGRVGGTIYPALCNQLQNFDVKYKLQFSHN